MQAPTIAGTVAIGETLTGTPQGFNDEDGDGEGTHRYQWYRATDAAGTQRTPIDGATALQYMITARRRRQVARVRSDPGESR